MSPSYATFDPKGWCGDPRRGAALGRPTVKPDKHPADWTGKLYLRRVHLDNGGYDKNGTYFGHGAPLYWYAGEDEDGESVDAMLRASDRKDAIAQVMALYPKATLARKF